MTKSILPMSIILRWRFFRVVLFVAANSTVFGQVTTNLYYDANGTTNGIGGTGNWTTTGTNWTTNTTRDLGARLRRLDQRRRMVE